MNDQEWLSTIALRLDELADDGPAELADLAEDLGKIVDRWPTAPPTKREDNPRWLAEIQHIVERAAQEIFYERYGNADGRYATFSIPNPDYQRMVRDVMAAGLPSTLDPKAIFKGTGV